MSLERVLKALEEFNISKKEANIYIYLAKKGPKNAAELSKELNIPKKQLFPFLQNIENKGLIMDTRNKTIVYAALPFEKLIECIVHIKMQKAKEINNKKIELLALWKSLENEKEKRQRP